MKIPVNVRVNSVICQDNQKEEIVTVSDGEMEVTDDGITVYYMESPVDEDVDVPVCMTFKKNAVTNRWDCQIKKTGLIQSDMLFMEGELTTSVYETPMGSIVFDILSKEVDLIEIPGRTDIRLEYVLLAGGEVISEAVVTIVVLAA